MKRLTMGQGIIFLSCFVAGLIITMVMQHQEHAKPHGTVTEKIWTQAVWENGEQIIPPRFCLEIDDNTETCVDVNTFNKYKLGGQYP